MEPSERVAPLSLQDFTQHLAVELELEHSSLTPAVRFFEDLSFDSIQMLELSVVVEELGVELDDNDLENLATVDLAYAAYSRAYLRSDISRDTSV